ncbi:MAG: ABC transporter ATP-binding protein [Peptoniphilaceae bacterium]|nr:ABC transporter ATP-binding protein [Peptoniphilaceae bacterium]MDY6085923.1 ABC transporter ATP-binding protein [Peptoniphilaceae bacterium]
MPKDRESKQTWGQLRRLSAFAKPYLRSYLVIFFLMFCSIGAGLLGPKIIQVLIDRHLNPLGTLSLEASVREAHVQAAFRLGFIYLLSVIVNFITMYGSDFLMHKTGAHIVTDLRRKLYRHVLNLPMRYFDQHAIGGIVTRLTNDTENVLDLYTYVFTNFFRNIVMILSIIVVMFSLDVRLASLVLLFAPVVAAISVVFQKQIRIIYDKQRAIRSLINTKLSENLSGMSVIQIFHREKAIFDEFDETSRAYYDVSRNEVRDYAIYRPLVELLQALGLAMLFWFGGRGQMRGALTFGVLYAFINYLQRFFRPILDMAEIFNIMQSSFSSSSRLMTLLDQEEEEYGKGVDVPEGGFVGKIEFDHVWFRYNHPEDALREAASEDATLLTDGYRGDADLSDAAASDEWILKDVSFTIEPGSFVAFVGATGAGKSTILSLIARFYPVDKGEIRIDGVNVNDYDLVQLRRALGTVQQDVFLFRGDILGNIAIGRPDVGRREIVEAARLVNAEDFICQLPKGYDEPVMERGATLSAGQRQLLSFARTIAGDPSILILDEATANIDTQTEQLIQKAIAKMAQNRTMLAVAHRISTIAGADQIIVMNRGEIAERGTQDELLAKDGLFRVLYELQYGKEVSHATSE